MDTEKGGAINKGVLWVKRDFIKPVEVICHLS